MADSQFNTIIQAYLPNYATPTTIEALRFYIQNELQAISSGMLALNADYRENLVFAGYGAASLSVATALPDITVAWQTLPLDTSLADSRDVSYNLANDAVIFRTEGVWRGSLNFSMEFTEVNAGRSFAVRVWNLTDSVSVSNELALVPVYVGRNQGGVNFSFQANIDLNQINVGDEIVVQVGSASTAFTGVTLEANRADFNRVSEVKT